MVNSGSIPDMVPNKNDNNMKTTKQQISISALHHIEHNIQHIFNVMHDEFKTVSGDISPDQQLELDNLKIGLVKLVAEQVYQNLPETEPSEKIKNILEEMEASGYYNIACNGTIFLCKETSFNEVRETFGDDNEPLKLTNGEHGCFYRGVLFWVDDNGFMVEHDKGSYMTHGICLAEKAIREFWEV